MFAEAMDDSNQPLFALDCHVKLLAQLMIVLERFADSHEFAFARKGAFIYP